MKISVLGGSGILGHRVWADFSWARKAWVDIP